MDQNKNSQSPKHIRATGSTTVVVFIHGIVEGPAQFYELMELTVHLGYSAASLLLPGHGGTGKEFARSSRSKWIKYVHEQIISYKKQYKEIILVGHSMGTLLSFIDYVENPKQITGIISMNSPLHVKVRRMAIRNNLKIGFSKEIPEDDPAHALLQASSVEPCSVFTYITWAPRIIDLFHLIKQTRKLLYRITVPTLVIHADKDELVGNSSVRIFERSIPKEYLKIIRLPESTHFTHTETDLNTLHKEYCNFLKSKDVHYHETNKQQ